MEECVTSLLCLQEVANDAYELQLTRVGTMLITPDHDTRAMTVKQVDELKKLTNMISPYAFRLTSVSIELLLGTPDD